jgi:UDP-glucose 4-epimerase
MERILVTGGAGYVGSTCCRQLVERGFSVEVLDDLSTGHADAVPEGVKVNQCDFGDRDTLNLLLAGKRFDAVFHFAAKALIPESVVNPGPFFDTNVASSIAMLEALRQRNIRQFVFSSSAAVYGLPKSVPIDEDHPQEPVNAYGESKLSLERILKWYAAAYGWSVVAFRYFNACGGGKEWGERHEPETHILPLLLQTASGRRQCFEIYGMDYPTPDGTCVRDYVHVLDIAEAHILALKKMDLPGFHAYNIGTGTSYSVQEIRHVAEGATNKKIKIRQAGRRLGDPAILCASPKKLMSEFGWAPSHSGIEEIIKGAWEWEQEQCKRALAEQTF